jgi:hypothetical protein
MFPSATVIELEQRNKQNRSVVLRPTGRAPYELLSRPHFAGDKNWQVVKSIT